MRILTSPLAVLLVACSPQAPIFTPETPSNDALVAGRLHGVKLSGRLEEFSARTREGWGVVEVFDDRFTFDIRGPGKGVLMNAITIHRNVERLQLGDAFDVRGPPLVGCAGDIESEWTVEFDTWDATFQVVDETPELVVIEFGATFEHLVVIDEVVGRSRGVVTIPRSLY